MPPPHHRALIDLLKRPENILCAIEISDAIEYVKEDLRRAFWEQIDSDFNKKEHVDEFRCCVSGLGDLEKCKFRSKGGTKGVYLHADALPRGALELRCGVFQEPDEKIYYGIEFSNKQPVPHPLREVADLLESIRRYDDKMKIVDVKEEGDRRKWLCWRKELEGLSREFYLAAASDCMSLTRPITETVFDFLRSQYNLFQTASQALAAST